MNSRASVAVRFACCALLAACSGRSSGAGSTAAVHALAAGVAADGSVTVALTAPQVMTTSLATAHCHVEAPVASGGGLQVSATGSEAVQRVLLVAHRVGGNGDDQTTPTDPGMSRKWLRGEIAMDDAMVFTGGPGSVANVHATDGGRSGTFTFSHATYAGASGVRDAAGTISWTCK